MKRIIKSRLKNTHWVNACLMLFIIISTIITTELHAQEVNPLIDQSDQKEVIDTLIVKLNNMYVFPEVAKEMTALVKKKFDDGEYNELIDPQDFTSQLTIDLQSVSNDKHLRLVYGPKRIAMVRNATNNDDELRKLELERSKNNNFMFEEIKILPGNIGYLKFNGFLNTEIAGPTATAAMQFLANTKAIIFDLRDNGGGSPSMVMLLTTYLFEGEAKHINSFYWRPTDDYQQFWTLPYVDGKRSPDADVYVLTSSRTFSAAEEFTYNLKYMERATIVGETTRGGAHPVNMEILNDKFAIALPKGRAINPITKTNWEGVGIEPHFKVDRKDALNKAQSLALEKLIEKESNEDKKNLMIWSKVALDAKLNPVRLDMKIMKQYVGTYGPRKVSMENGELYYQREEKPKMKMTAMNENTFMLDELNYFRLKFIKEGKKITALHGLYDDGQIDISKKD